MASAISVSATATSGTGVAKDLKAAVGWFRKASEQGLPEATAELATMCRSGTRRAQEWSRGRATEETGGAATNGRESDSRPATEPLRGDIMIPSAREVNVIFDH